MSRIGVIAVHVAALPLALLLAVPVAIAVGRITDRAVDIHMDDTFFVVAHFHLSVLLAAAVIAVTLVARWRGTTNWALWVSWLLLGVHVISAVLPWAPPAAHQAEQNEVVFATAARPELALVYVVSAVASSCTSVVALVVSLWRSVRTREALVG